MKKITLVHPPPSEQFADITFSQKDAPCPPQTAPAELGAYVKAYASADVQVQGINPEYEKQGRIEQYSNTEIAELCADSDIVGLSCLYHNQESAQEIAKAIKQKDPTKTVVLGGQNVSNIIMARLVLETTPAIDYIVLGEGEDALLGIVEGQAAEEIPNLAYRNNGTIRFTEAKQADLNKIPVWDYADTLNAETLTTAHNSESELYAKLSKENNGRSIGEIGVFSRRGCAKAAGEVGKVPGTCRYCTSVKKSNKRMNPANFWRQVEHLNKKYGIQDLFIADNVFGTRVEELEKFVEARKQFEIPDTVEFRSYTYPSIIHGTDGEMIAKLLKEMGVVNLFLGIETFSQEVSKAVNKDPVSLEAATRAIETISNAGMDTFVSFMPGMPGETRESLEHNLDCLEILVSKYGSVEYGEGNLVRIDLSPAMPLVGTSWYNQLVHDDRVIADYHKETDKELDKETTPDFEILRNISIRYFSEVTPEDIDNFMNTAKEIISEHLSSDSIGAFDLRKDGSTGNVGDQ